MTEFVLSYQNVFDQICLNVLLVFSMYVTLSAGMFALANIGFMAVGAYTSALLTTKLGVPFVLAHLAAVGAAALLAFAIGRPVLTLRGDYLAIATIAFGEIVRMVVLNTERVTGGSLGVNNIPRHTATWMLVLGVVMVAAFFHFVDRTKIGAAIRAIREDEVVAGSFGIDVPRYKLAIFMFSSVLAAEAGVLAAHLNFFISPAEFTFHTEVQILAFAIFGGVGHWMGTAVGAIVLTLLPEVLRGLSYIKEFLIGLVMVATILFQPYGLYPLLQGLRRPRPDRAVAS